jgi:hypothetical protein
MESDRVEEVHAPNLRIGDLVDVDGKKLYVKNICSSLSIISTIDVVIEFTNTRDKCELAYRTGPELDLEATMAIYSFGDTLKRYQQ